MGEKVRRFRLLAAVAVAGLLAFVAAWPSQGAAAEAAPLYLARERGPAGTSPEAATLVAVADAPRLAAHLLADGENLGGLEVTDGAGRVVVLGPTGKVEPTGAALDPAAVRTWLRESFKIRLLALNAKVVPNSTTVCRTMVDGARSRLDLPTHAGPRELTLAETLAEADVRIAAMHRPENQIPYWCLRWDPQSAHKAGYLHNLWHRIMGTT